MFIQKNKIRFFSLRIFALVFAGILLMSSVCGVCSVLAVSAQEISSPSAILMEPYTKQILFEKNSHEIRACASITKVMTLILVFEAIEQGKIDYEDEVCASAHAAGMGGSDIWLEEGEVMTVHEMIKAVVVASANDAAVALAEFISGTEDEFVSRMNQRAKELGMNDTVFKNCNGLDEEGHLTSAYDVALMSAQLICHEKIFEYSSIWIDYLRDGETQIVNTNKLLKSYKGITGLKTGTTSMAGSCMSATAQRDGLSLVAVVLGCDTGKGRFADCATLLDFGFANYQTAELILPNGCLEPVKIKGGMEDAVQVECNPRKSVIMPKGNSSQLTSEFLVEEELVAPVQKGQVVGKVTFYCGEATVDECNITAIEEVKELNFTSIVKILWQNLISL